MHLKQRVSSSITEVPCKIDADIKTVCLEIVNPRLLLGYYERNV